MKNQTSTDAIVATSRARAATERELAVSLHDVVRDHILFGFTPYFDAATPSRTLRLRRGHCNPQARLMVTLFRKAGFAARFRPVTIDNEILRRVATTPRLLSHVFTEVELHGKWIRLDSYIVDPALRVAAVEKLKREGRDLGYGCHVSASSEWDGLSDCYSQVATPEMILETHEPVDEITDFYRSPRYRHRFGRISYSRMMTPWRLVQPVAMKTMNLGIDRVRTRLSKEAP